MNVHQNIMDRKKVIQKHFYMDMSVAVSIYCYCPPTKLREGNVSVMSVRQGRGPM